MQTIIEKDFEELINFLEDYEVKQLIKHEKIKRSILRLHKYYFALITCVGELDYLMKKNKVSKSPYEITHLKEVCSDLGHALFCFIQGSYKSAAMLLRGAIENQMRAIIGESKPGKNYGKVLFNYASSTFSKFSMPRTIIKSLYDNHYGLLSGFVHTSSMDNMEQTSALNYFPAFAEEPSKKLDKEFANICQKFIFLICSKHNDLFFEMHKINQSIILKGIDPNLRTIIMGDNVK